MKVTEAIDQPTIRKPSKSVVPLVPADHPDLFESLRSELLEQQDTTAVPPAPAASSGIGMSPVAPLSASTSATFPPATASEASPTSSVAPTVEDDFDAIFPSTEPDPPLTVSPEIRQVNTGWLKPHEWSVRVYGGALADKELVTSVRDQGILTPLHVTPEGIVISGHRRLDAAKEALLKTVPVYVIGPKGNRVGGIEEQILEANRYRTKNAYEIIREFIAYKQIETARAKHRCGYRWDLVPKSAPGEDAMPLPGEGIYSLATLKQDMGKARDLAAKKVGLSGSTAALGEKVVFVLDRLRKEESYENHAWLRQILCEKSINAAHREAIQKGWLPTPTKRQPKKAEPHDTGARVTDRGDDAPEDQPVGSETATAAPPAGMHPEAMADSLEAPTPECAAATDVRAQEPTPASPESSLVSVRQGTAVQEGGVVSDAPHAGVDQPRDAVTGTQETLSETNGEAGSPPSLFGMVPSIPAAAPPTRHADASITPPESFPVSDGEDGAAGDADLIPADKVQQAVERVSVRGLALSDQPDLLPHVRRVIPLVAALLNQYMHESPDLDGRDLSRVLGLANTKLQLSMGWA